MSSMSIERRLGDVEHAEVEPEPHVLACMLSPSVATLRPDAIAASAICWMRWRWLAKLAVMIRRPRCSVNSERSTPPTLVSLGA